MSERNPFSKKSNEQFSDSHSFLDAFSPIILDKVRKATNDQLLNQIIVYRSPPGFGKSTFLRLFSSSVLGALQRLKSGDLHTNTVNCLKDLDVFGAAKPKVLGVYLNVADGYAEIQDIFGNQSLSIFRAMINAKIILKFVSSLRDYYELSFGEPLDDFELEATTGIEWGALPKSNSLSELYKWAEELEHKIARGISDLELKDYQSTNHSSFSSIDFLNSIKVKYKGQQQIRKFLLMIDDVHRLRSIQRMELLDALVVLRPSFPVWIAERLSCLSSKEALIEGADEGREYRTVTLDELFPATANNVDFKKFINSIVHYRMRKTTISGFDSWLNAREEDFASLQESILVEMEKKLEEVKSRGGYDEWVDKLQLGIENSNRARKIDALQELFSAIAKYENKNSFPLLEVSATDMPRVDKSFIKFYLHRRYKVPYFYGDKVLWSLATFSVLEFLDIAEALFEEVYLHSLSTRSKKNYIGANKQEQIIKQLAKTKYRKINNLIIHPKKAILFLDNFARVAMTRSEKESSPYTPSITGFAITDADLDELVNEPKFESLRRILTDFRTNNYVVIRRQEKSGEIVNIFYLNRLLCAHFDLAVGYGGWNKFDIQELDRWLKVDLSKESPDSVEQRYRQGTLSV